MVRRVWSWIPDVWVLVKSTPQVEKTRPMAAMIQNGATSRQKWDRPDLPQAQLRLSQ